MSAAERSSQAAAKGQTLKIAVTGSAGSGKSTVCDRLRQLGLTVVSADALARKAVLPGTPAYQKIIDHFGPQVLSADGTLDRPALRHRMLNDVRARQTLEKLIHPEVLRQIGSRARAAAEKSEPAVVVEIPLLFEVSAQDEFDLILLVVSDREAQIERLMRRDQVARDSAAALLDSQLPDRVKLQSADFVIYNRGSKPGVLMEVDRFYRTVFKNK